jgi:hypothetical protein
MAFDWMNSDLFSDIRKFNYSEGFADRDRTGKR